MAKLNEVRVLLVRSGQTAWDEAGRIAGSSDLPLSPIGLLTAQVEARKLQGTSFAAVLSGPDEGSIVTAGLVAEATGAKVKTVKELGDICLGLWEGLLESELEDKCPRAHRQWIDDPASVVVPEGESIEEAQSRIIGALGKALSRHKADAGAVAVVLRPFALALVRCRLMGCQSKDLRKLMEVTGPGQWVTVQPRTLVQRREASRTGL